MLQTRHALPPLWSAVIVLVALGAGCQTRIVESGPTPNGNTQANPGTATDASPDLASADFWQADFIQDQPVGWTHTTVTTQADGDQSLLLTVSESQLSIRRFGTVLTQKIHLESVDAPDGRLARCRAETTTGPEKTTVEATVDGSTLRFRAATPGRVQEDQLPWRPEYGGYFATEQNLKRKPMSPGERRQFKALIPVLNQLGDVELVADDWQETRLLNESARLLKIDQHLRIGDNRLQAVLWADEQGELRKQELPALKQVSYRTTQEIAQRGSSNQSFDLGAATVVKLTPAPVNLHERTQAVLRVEVTGESASQLFPSSLSQSVRESGSDSAEVVVLAVRPDRPSTLPEKIEATPGDDDLSPNSRIQSDDPRILRLANEVAADSGDPWVVAQALERHVHETVQVKGFSLALATAVTVAETREGDCTEHAVLMAALCRARKLPARVAIGLVYSPQLEGYAYHMWNEVWIRDRWIPLDATLGRGGIGCGHLKLADSSLRAGDDSAAFLPVLRVLGKLRIEVKSAE